MIKVVAPAQRHPTNRNSLEDFHRYWAESHGPLFANTKRLRRYVQHLTLPESYGIDPAPSFDGVSMFWYDEYLPPDASESVDEDVTRLHEAVLRDDRQLFDRSDTWPMHHKSASVVAEEHVVVDGATNPDMVKAIFIASKLPGLTLTEFFDHWLRVHGPLGARLPGLRRYVQNHGLLAAYVHGQQTHDGWSELWFDDLAALHRAVRSPQWQVLREDGATLFASPMGVGVARERVQKDLDWTYRDWGVGALDEDGIRQRLLTQGYRRLSEDPEVPLRIRQAATEHRLAVWTDEHLLLFGAGEIDARPES